MIFLIVVGMLEIPCDQQSNVLAGALCSCTGKLNKPDWSAGDVPDKITPWSSTLLLKHMRTYVLCDMRRMNE